MISNALNAEKNIRIIKDIELNYDSFSMSNITVYRLFTRGHTHTHLNKICVYKGLQRAIYVVSVVYGPLRAHVNERKMCMGCSSNPLIHPLTNCHIVNRVNNRPCSPVRIDVDCMLTKGE